MSLSVDDRLAIHDLINFHGHICDAGAFERFDELLTEDVVYDVSEVGSSVVGDFDGVMRGLDEVRRVSVALGAGNPVAHMVTNIVIGAVTADGVDVLSKGLSLMASGAVGAVTYRDRVVRTADGWRIAHRQVGARREPLTPYELPAPESAAR